MQVLGWGSEQIMNESEINNSFQSIFFLNWVSQESQTITFFIRFQ